MKVIFAGTPEFAVAPLSALIDSHDVVAVFTQPDRRSGRGKKLSPPPVKRVAEQHNIPVFQPTSLKNEVANVQALNADIMVVVAYGMLLPQSILDVPALGCLNIHASLLPRWRGAAPIQRAIEAGDSETGASIMQMERGLDTGPVFQMRKIMIAPDETSASLHDKLAALGAEGIIETLTNLAENPKLVPTPQDHDQSCYAKKIEKHESIVDWNLSAAAIDRKARAFFPWPGCQTQHGDTRLRISDTHPNVQDATVSQQSAPTPGTIIALDDDGISVACATGSLKIGTLQRDGSRAMPYKEFRNGYPLSVGDQLG
ncbi:methionyl-tRNA formyltransferase [Arenicella xantha]|uniref:Methionyl-tRNA formyltransferase n=1 Tax=Arenicella xantha TaxID=644221 RepID=A0A395JGB8_9GAMM|nr:methionyl-tRNA formyltransferase [Arenicella xantha]RBP48832.1 methionyl-tRNA formyltransferase [Arenicella xantha]